MILNLAHRVKDSLTSEWKLLSETENIVSQTPEYATYEGEFRYWRKMLQTEKENTKKQEIREEIVALRKELRLHGYDLSLGSLRLVVDGFKNDDAMADGYQRIVLCFNKEDIFIHLGSRNHIELGEELEKYLYEQNVLYRPEYHYLWYLKTQQTFYISGAATELADDFERLRARANANPLKILSALKRF